MSNEHNTSKKPKIAPYQHPLLNALGWVFLFLVAACLGLVLFYICREDIGVLFGAKDSLWTIDNSIKIVIGIFALFAFVVTIWRGNLHAQQVFGQIEQLELGREQLEKTENNNVAKLLVDGTKLLGDETSEAEKMAGIACLSNIAEAQSPFVKQAIRLVKTFIHEQTNSSTQSSIMYGSKKDKKASFIKNRTSVKEALNVLCSYAAKYAEKIECDDMTISSLNFHKGEYSIYLRKINFHDCKFSNCSIMFTASQKFENCTFSYCTIHARSGLGINNRFTNCFIENFYSFSLKKTVGAKFFECVYNDYKIDSDDVIAYLDATKGVIPWRQYDQTEHDYL